MTDDLDNLPRTPNTFQPGTPNAFQPGTMNQGIFEQNAPYNNPYQGNRRRILFVCSAGLLRSPTGAYVGALRGYNTRSCGSATAYALIPLSANLIMWADTIVFVNQENQRDALRTFANSGYHEHVKEKSVVLDIPDQYEAFDPVLLAAFNEWFDSVDYDKA